MPHTKDKKINKINCNAEKPANGKRAINTV